MSLLMVPGFEKVKMSHHVACHRPRSAQFRYLERRRFEDRGTKMCLPAEMTGIKP